MENNKSVWSVLSKINCNDKTEKKNGLTYLSWSWACICYFLFVYLK